jgi:RNA polymerase sigma-70 factor, ECF subfamily
VTGAYLESQAATDLELAQRAADGELAAFESLAGRYKDLMYGVCRRITCNDQDALDALQEALVTMWRRIGSFEGRSALGTWLYRVAANAAIDEVRRRSGCPVPILESGSDRPGGHDVEASVVAASTVDWALGKLPPQFRAALVLREYYDCTYQQIAEIMEVPVDTVQSRISRGRQALAELLRAPGLLTPSR